MDSKIERRTHGERRDEAETRMLETGVRLVAQRGLERLTLADVGIGAGYSRGLPAHHFGAKADFQVALAAYIRREFLDRIAGPSRNRGIAGLRDLLHIFFERSSRDPLSAFFLTIILSEAPDSGAFSTEIAKLRTVVFDGIAQHVSEGIGRGEIRPDVKPRQVTLLLVSALDGVLREWLFDGRVDIAEAGRELSVLTLAGLATTAPDARTPASKSASVDASSRARKKQPQA